jgi:hypothetical protein
MSYLASPSETHRHAPGKLRRVIYRDRYSGYCSFPKKRCASVMEDRLLAIAVKWLHEAWGGEDFRVPPIGKRFQLMFVRFSDGRSVIGNSCQVAS